MNEEMNNKTKHVLFKFVGHNDYNIKKIGYHCIEKCNHYYGTKQDA